jgi:hypothetical protein
MPFSRFSGIIAHVIGWLLLFSLILAFTHSTPGGENMIVRIFSPENLLFYSLYIFLFYLNISSE